MKQLLLLFTLNLLSLTISAQEVATVSTLAELQEELDRERSIDIVVNNKIELTNGTNLDGHGRTIRVPNPYLKEDGTVNTVTDGNGYLRNGPDDATTIDNGNVFTIPAGAIVTLNNMTIMGGRIKFVTGKDTSTYTDKDGIEWDRVNTKNASQGQGPEYAANAAVVVKEGGTLTMENCTVTRSNRGICNVKGTVVLSHCNLIRNYCRFGSGVLNDGGGTKGAAKILMDRCSFSENRSYQDGGAAENKAGGVMYISNSTMSNNTCATYAVNNYSAASSTYPSEMYFLNSTISGNLVHYNQIAFRTGQGNVYGVNSIFTDNVHMDRSSKEITYKGFAGNQTESIKTYMYNCISTTDDGSAVTYTNCQAPYTTQNIFDDYVTSGLTYNIQLGNGTDNYNGWATNMLNTLISSNFKHTALVNKDGHYSAPLKNDGAGETGGCKTYFNYSLDGSTLNVNMAFDNDGTKTKICGDNWESAPEVDIYIDGTTRVEGVIGSSPVVESSPTGTYHTLYLDPSYTGGVVYGATVFGDTYEEGTEVTVTADAEDGYAFLGWTVNTDTDNDGTYDNVETVIGNPYTITMNHRTLIKPTFASPHDHDWAYLNVTDDPASVITYCENDVTVGDTGLRCSFYGTTEDHPIYLTLTVSPPENLQKNGKAKYVSVNAPSIWPATYTTAYYSTSAHGTLEGGTLLEGAPTDEGHYYAVVTTGEEGNYVEAKVAFSIIDLTIRANQDPQHLDDYYTTFYSSYYNYKYPDNLTTAYTAVTKEENDGKLVLTLTPLSTNEIIPKSTPVILKGTRLDGQTADDKTTTFTMVPTQNDASFDGSNDLRGLDETTTISSLTEYANYDIYTLAAKYFQGEYPDGTLSDTPTVGFYLYKGTSLGANKAFLPLAPLSTASNALLFTFEDEGLTGIGFIQEEPTHIDSTKEMVIYNLNGQRLSRPMHGLNIINGKKVYIK